MLPDAYALAASYVGGHQPDGPSLEEMFAGLTGDTPYAYTDTARVLDLQQADEPDLPFGMQTLTEEAYERHLANDKKTIKEAVGLYLLLSDKTLGACGPFAGSSGSIMCCDGHEPVLYARKGPVRNDDDEFVNQNKCWFCGSPEYRDVLNETGQ